MPRRALTERALKEIQPETWPDVCRLGHQTCTGFGVRVSAGGTKTFVYVYRTPGGRQRWKPLGRVGNVALEQARRLAKVDIGVVASRQDPLRQTDAARRALTLEAVSELWMTELEQVDPATGKAKRKPSTLRNYRQALDAYIRPLLGTVPMVDISQADAIRLHESLQSIPTQANRVLRALSSLLTWSMRGERPYRSLGPNPCFGIEHYPERKRTRYLKPDEYARVGKALRTAPLAPSIRTATSAAAADGSPSG